MAWAYWMVVLIFAAVGAAGAIATLTWFTTEGFVGTNSFGR
jgi:hypothetical protein